VSKSTNTIQTQRAHLRHILICWPTTKSIIHCIKSSKRISQLL